MKAWASESFCNSFNRCSLIDWSKFSVSTEQKPSEAMWSCKWILYILQMNINLCNKEGFKNVFGNLTMNFKSDLSHSHKACTNYIYQHRIFISVHAISPDHVDFPTSNNACLHHLPPLNSSFWSDKKVLIYTLHTPWTIIQASRFALSSLSQVMHVWCWNQGLY